MYTEFWDWQISLILLGEKMARGEWQWDEKQGEEAVGM